MVIPPRLDGFAIGNRIITPRVVSNKDTTEVEVEVLVTNAKTNAIIETRMFSSEEAYLKYVKTTLGKS
jgi:hypothetical protein